MFHVVARILTYYDIMTFPRGRSLLYINHMTVYIQRNHLYVITDDRPFVPFRTHLLFLRFSILATFMETIAISKYLTRSDHKQHFKVETGVNAVSKTCLASSVFKYVL